LVKQPTVIGETTIDNDSGATIRRHFTYTHTSTDTYEWHVTGGVKVTAGASAKVTLPLVGEGEANTSVELNVEGGSNTSTEETETWDAGEEIEVPPQTTVDAKALLSIGQVTGTPFKAHMYAYGQVGVHVQYGTNAWTWEWADLDTGGWWGAANNPVTKPPLDPQDRQFVVERTFDGTVGLIVVVTARPLLRPARPPPCEPEPRRSLSLLGASGRRFAASGRGGRLVPSRRAGCVADTAEATNTLADALARGWPRRSS
jgi:hypothetical protein